jgi:3-hydroxyacyl-CoA dehydrogenase/enoyl-CoA hydratase/3-hydroxybutyryl-CoA epimerase
VSESAQALLAGTGKMARDVGVWLLRKGFHVGFVGRDPAHVAELRRRIEADLRRLEDEDVSVAKAATSFHLPADPLPCADVVLECVVESLDAKRATLDALAGAAKPGALVVSTSSSILPSAIHPRCAVVHFFYPVQLTGFVELIVPAGRPAAPFQDFVRELGLRPIVQDEARAFAVNRLLLPVQSNCLAALQSGLAPAQVDEASRSRQLPAGQLSLMDAIGLDTLAAAIANYLARMGASDAREHAPLLTGVRELVGMGKLGQKNSDGFLCGRPLPWTVPGRTVPPAFPGEVADLFRRTCERFIRDGQLTEGDLRLALAGLFGVE